MQKIAWLETLTGLVVLLLAGSFLTYGLQKTNRATGDTYSVTAAFDNISGINRGADIKLSGVKIGTVADIHIQPQTYQAEATLSLQSDITLPSDSVVKIVSDGLLGGAYLTIEAGSEVEILKAGGQFAYTQSAVSIMDLLSRAVFSANSGAGSAEAK